MTIEGIWNADTNVLTFFLLNWSFDIFLSNFHFFSKHFFLLIFQFLQWCIFFLNYRTLKHYSIRFWSAAWLCILKGISWLCYLATRPIITTGGSSNKSCPSNQLFLNEPYSHYYNFFFFPTVTSVSSILGILVVLIGANQTRCSSVISISPSYLYYSGTSHRFYIITFFPFFFSNDGSLQFISYFHPNRLWVSLSSVFFFCFWFFSVVVLNCNTVDL